MFLDSSMGSVAVQSFVSAMAAFSAPATGQMDIDLPVRNDANVSAAPAVRHRLETQTDCRQNHFGGERVMCLFTHAFRPKTWYTLGRSEFDKAQ